MDPGKTPRSERAAETRERILLAATELMAAQGYAGTSVTELCERAQVVRPVLYSHFGSKEGLLGAVIEHCGNGVIDELKGTFYVHDAREGPKPSGPERLMRALAAYRKLIIERPERLRLLLLITLERGESSPEVRRAMQRYQERAIKTVIDAIEDVVGRSLPDMDLLALVVISVLQGAHVRRVFDPDSPYFDRLWAELAQTVSLGVSHRLKQLRG